MCRKGKHPNLGFMLKTILRGNATAKNQTVSLKPLMMRGLSHLSNQDYFVKHDPGQKEEGHDSRDRGAGDITYSQIELTDTSGNKRTMVKREC